MRRLRQREGGQERKGKRGQWSGTEAVREEAGENECWKYKSLNQENKKFIRKRQRGGGGGGRCVYLGVGGGSVSVMDHSARACACNVLLKKGPRSLPGCTAGRGSFPPQHGRVPPCALAWPMIPRLCLRKQTNWKEASRQREAKVKQFRLGLLRVWFLALSAAP